MVDVSGVRRVVARHLACSTIASVVLLSGCSSEGIDGETASDQENLTAADIVPTLVDPTGIPAGPSAVTCSGLSAPLRDYEWTIDVGGAARTALVHLPPSYDPAKGLPVVLNFHGFAQQPADQAQFTGMNAHADEAEYVAIYPRGVGQAAPWNAGACCLGANSTADDVGFIRALLDALPSELCVDPSRIFATGFSNGAMMVHRLACELDDRIAAFAADAGGLLNTPCSPKRPISMLAFHGTLDPVVPYGGNPVLGFAPIRSVMAGWAGRSGCGPSETVTRLGALTQCRGRDHCSDNAEITLCTVDGGGHTWPGGEPTAAGLTASDISATDLMWTFFKRHQLP